MKLVAITLIALNLASCGERASCWNDQRGRFTSCDQVRDDEIERRIEKSRLHERN